MFSILIADANVETNKNVTDFFKSFDNFKVASTTSGLEAIEFIESHKPDIVITDLILNDIDGFEVMATFQKRKPRPIFLVLSLLVNNENITKALDKGASYFLCKSVGYTLLKERIVELLTQSVCATETTNIVAESKAEHEQRIHHAKIMKMADEKISNILIAMGIPAHIKGYSYLRDAIKLVMNEPDIINNITKRLYPEVAEHFNTAASKVERAIRHAIEVAWNRGRLESLNNLFGFKVYGVHDKPTNGEFIALVADKLLMELI